MSSFGFESPRPYEIHLPDGDYIAKRIQKLGMPYEYYAMRSIADLVRDGAAILDVGANVGNHSLYWSASGYSVVAFEPNPEALRWLRINIDQNSVGDLIDLRPFGLGATRARAALQLSPGNLGATSTELSDSGTVEIWALDDLQLPDEIGAVKIDVEGGEAAVLLGARQTLLGHKPVIMIELWDKNSVSVAGGLLQPLGYRRLPFTIGGGPTYVYLPGAKALMKAMISWPTLWAGIRVKASRGRRWLRTHLNVAALVR